GQRRPICVDQVYRAPGRSGHRTLRRQRRRLLRQRSRRDDQCPVQGRSDPSAWAMALVRGRRVRDAGMGRLVQQSPAAGAHRLHPAGRSRGTLLRYARRAGHGSVTQTKMPPAIPARFKAFYRGELAARIADFAALHGAALTREDLAAHRNDWCGTISMDYAGVQLHEIPPNGQGIVALIALGILEHLPLSAFGPDSAQSLHYQIEAIKLAMADVERYVSDPAYMDVPVEALLDKDYLKR